MDFLFFALLVLMLLVFGYAQLKKGVVKIPGQIQINEEEEIEIK